MSKRIAEAFRNGEYVQPRISTEAARWLRDSLQAELTPKRDGKPIQRLFFTSAVTYATEIIGAIQCELDELKPE